MINSKPNFTYKTYLRIVVVASFLVYQSLVPLVAIAATNSWDFATSGDYTFSATDIEFTGGNAQLKAAATWNDILWLRRRPITIDNTANSTTFTNMQVKIDVTYDSDMQADFDDIRFTDADGTTDLDFWLETKTNSTSATFWVEVPSITGSASKTIYMYYQNTAASSGSSGANTFVEFDDFTTSSSDHQFAFGSDSGYMSGFNPVNRQFYFLGAVMDNLVDYNVSTWANIDTWEVGFAYPSMTHANASVVWHPTLQKFYIYGGTDGNSTTLSRVHSFDPATNTFTQLAETLPQAVVNPGAVYNPEDDKIYLFGGRRTFTGATSTFSNTIYVHNLDLGTPTITNTTATLPVASEGMEPVYSSEDGKIYLFGGAYNSGSALASQTVILSYDPSSPSTNPVDTGSDLPTGRDTFGSAYANGNVYIFGGYNWGLSAYYDTVYKYDISGNSLTTLAATIPHSDDDMKAFYDSVTDKIYIGPLLHSTSVSNEDERKVVILEFDPDTETFAAEPSLGGTPSGWSSTGTASIDQPRAVGGSMTLSDHSTTTYVATQRTITALAGNKMIEYKVDVANSLSNLQFYVGPSSFNFLVNSASVLRNYATTSWQLGTAAATNQAIATIPTGKHIIGQLIDMTNSKQYGLVNRANRTSDFSWITSNTPLVKLQINTPGATSANGHGVAGLVVDWMIVRNATTGTEPSTTVGSEETVYVATNPTIVPNTAVTFTSISAFTETATKNSGEIKYQLSNDGGSTWYWYSSGWTTTSSGYTESSTGTVVDTNIATFPKGSGSFLFKAYLHSDGTQLVQLSNIDLTYLNDTVGPVRSDGAPSGEQSQGTTSTNLSLTTDEAATCKYDTVASTAYGSMSGTFDTTGGTSHLEPVSGLSDGQTYTYYVRCIDAATNANVDDYTISFSIEAASSDSESGNSSGSSVRSVRSNVSVVPQASPSINIFYRNFGIPSRDPEVLRLQNFLIGRSYLASGNNTGFFGPLTKQAVISYQKSHNIIPATGFFGPLTRSAVNAELSSGEAPESAVIPVTDDAKPVFTSPLALGSRGNEVTTLQKFLASLPNIYPEARVTGYFGVLTKSAVERFQLFYKVVNSANEAGFGTVGPKTRAMLNKLFSEKN